MDIDWNAELLDQIDLHWRVHLRPKLAGLTDDEYFWEPVAGCWNVRPRGTSTAPVAAGTGDFTIEFAMPEPDPPPVTTIAWRLSHIIVGVLGMRVASHFDGPAMDYQNFDYAGTASGALDQLDEVYANWITGVRGLDIAALARPCGPAEGPYADRSMATLVLHINREVLHQGAEILLLRDLYRAGRRGGSGPALD
jgi:hypothetical protein